MTRTSVANNKKMVFNSIMMNCSYQISLDAFVNGIVKRNKKKISQNL